MSRIGRKPIEIPSSVNIAISPGRVQVNGPLGELDQAVPARMKIEQNDGELVVTRPTERGEDRALHGLTRTLIANMVEGVTKGFEKHLEIQGVGYRAALRGTDLELNVGYSHSVVMKPRPGITFEVPVPTQVIVKGTDKQQVGQTAAEIRAVRKPEPYKGKGIRYHGRGRPQKGREARMSITHDTPGARAPAPPDPRQGRRHGRAAAPAVFRSNKGIFAQLIDDESGRTLAGASWLGLKKSFKGNKTEQAAEVGKAIAEAAKKAGIETVVFDRGGYLYHGRVKALADAAREGGLKF